MSAPVLPPNQSIAQYNATVEIQSSLHGLNRCGSGFLVRIDDHVYIATNFHGVGRFLKNNTPAYREKLTMRHIASNEVIHFGTASVLTDTLIVRNGSPTKDYLDNLDAVLIDIPINSTYLSLALFTQACSFEEVMGVVVHGFGCKFSSAKFFSGRVCSKIEEDTFCASSHGTPKGLSGSACTVGNICIGIIQSRTKTGLNHTVHDPSSQTLGSPAAFTTDRFVTALFGDSKLTYIMSSSVLLRIRAGILGGTGAPAITTLAVATAAVQDTEESIATSDDEEGEEDEAFRLVPVRHTKRRCGGGSRTAIAAAPVEPGLNIHKQNHYQCCSIS